MKKTLRLAQTEKPASLWKRGLAYVVDVLIISLVVSIPFNRFLRNYETDFTLLFSRTVYDKTFAFAALAIVVLTLIYWVALEYNLRQTIGKILFGLYVIPVEGKELTLLQVLIRNITKLSTVVLLVDTLYMIFKKGNQRLFELFSGTKVIEKVQVMKY